MARYLVIGAGKFGRLALERLSAADPLARFLVVDPRPEALSAAPAEAGDRVEVSSGDGISFLAAHLAPGCPWDWLIPAASVHVAWAWFLAGPGRHHKWQSVAVPDSLEQVAASALRGAQGELYLSRARHLCPDDCPEPLVCPVTGEDREPALWEELSALSRPEMPLVVVASELLAPGVGGYPPSRLLEVAAEALRISGPFFLATACRCHGVVHGLCRTGGGNS